MKQTRTYKLKVYPNYQKLEDVRYTSSRYKIYLQHFVTQLYYHPLDKFYSTKGMGLLANQAQKKAIGIVKGELEALKELNTQKQKWIYTGSRRATEMHPGESYEQISGIVSDKYQQAFDDSDTKKMTQCAKLLVKGIK